MERAYQTDQLKFHDEEHFLDLRRTSKTWKKYKIRQFNKNHHLEVLESDSDKP